MVSLRILSDALPALILLGIFWIICSKIASSFKMCQVDNCPGRVISEAGPVEILFKNEQRVWRETGTEVCDICGNIRRLNIEIPIPTKIN